MKLFMKSCAVGNGRGDENISNDQKSESGADEEPSEKSFYDKRQGVSSYRDFFAYF